MISLEKIVQIAEKYKMDETKHWKAVSEAYGDGAEEVLRELAMIKCFQMKKKNNQTPQIKEAIEKVTEHETDIRCTFADKHLDMFKEYENDMTHLMALECEEYFIQGFIEGYRFLKSINKVTFKDE